MGNLQTFVSHYRSDRSGSAYCIPPLERIDLDPVLGLLC